MVAPVRAWARAAALLMVAAAAVVALLSPVLSGGLAHRSAGPGLSATRTAAVATAARGSLGQTPERAARSAVLTRDIAQLSAPGSAPGGQHLTAALACAGLLLALAGRLVPARSRARTTSRTDRETQRNRGPPRAAARPA